MSPTCRPTCRNMSATDTNVCRLGGVADRHKSRHYQPSPAPPGTIDRLETALDNLALAAANDTTVLQQLTSANLALTATNATLTAANKNLSEALAKFQATRPTTPGPPPTSNKPFPGNYCWIHGHCVSQMHTSATCGGKATGHQDKATTSNTMGGSEKNKGWNTRCT